MYVSPFLCSEEGNQATAKLAFGFTERTTRKSEAAELRRYEVAGFSSLCEACGKEGPTVCS